MVFTQPINIPLSHRLTIEVPSEIPVGRAILTFTSEEEMPGDSLGRYISNNGTSLDDYTIPETMLLSEKSLAKEWDMPEEDEAWANL